jgi:hypothetical protein
MNPPRQFAASDDVMVVAAVDLIHRTGATQFQIRYCDEAKPVVWVAAARHGPRWEAAGAMNPRGAVFRLCDLLVDGGQCQHCGRPAGFEPSTDTMPLNSLVCWYQFDPGTKKFAKGCAR